MKKITTVFFIFISLICKAQHDYPKAQHLSTYFLGAQRCGDTDSWIHGACHLKDGLQIGKDLTGGWHDCGDYIKFHHTGPFTALMYLYGFENFTDAYADNYSQYKSAPPSNGIPDILDEVKIETDYLIRCINNGIIYWQIGDAKDHNSFSEPVTQSNESAANGGGIRPVLSTTSGHSNALGNAASALALMSIIYSPYDNAYATTCLNAGKEYYKIATTNPEGTADPDNFYGGPGGLATKKHEDELGLAAAILFRATNDNSYLVSAEIYSNTTTNLWDEFYYGNVHPLLQVELYKLTQKKIYLDNIALKVNNYSLSTCGYYHSTNWGSLPFAGNAAFLAALYHKLSGNINAYNFAKSNINFILGSHGYISKDAPDNFSFLIGYNELGGSYPKHPHHSAAFGKKLNAWTIYNNEKNNPGSETYLHELKGGLAGGPESECDNFTDNIDNYISSEYCSYYGAGFMGGLAAVNSIENNLTANSTDEIDLRISISYLSGSKARINLNSSTTLYVYSITGKCVMKSPKSFEHILDFKGLKCGVYFIKDLKSKKVFKYLNRQQDF